MREIKFRAWDKSEKRFFPISQIFTTIDNTTIVSANEAWSGEHHLMGSVVFMQYTGLKDKNGKEIYYDSDRVKFKFFYASDLIGLIGMFTFNDYELKAEIDIEDHPQGFTCLTYNPQTMKDFEVIGNIYEDKK